MKYTAKLKGKKEVAESTMAFYLERPIGFEAHAGQYMDVTLIDPPETDAEGNTRAFSIASAPSELDLMFATRMRDTAFKRVLKTMALGAEVALEGPVGSFTLHTDAARPAVFLIGGIGITPVRAILLDATHRQLPHRLYLFYSNRRPEDAAFLDELAKLEQKNPNYTFIGTMTDMKNSAESWAGEVGYITTEMLERHVPDTSSAICYVAGPSAMVAAMRAVLSQMGINEDNIRTEEFTGY